jgi:microcompartment protein CcmL/EutN
VLIAWAYTQLGAVFSSNPEGMTGSLGKRIWLMAKDRSSRQAVGTIETDGFPPVLAAADAMLKAGNVTLVYYGLAERAEFIIAVRGTVSAVEQAVAAGVIAGEATKRGTIISHYIIPNPPENVDSIMPIHYTEASRDFWV